MRINRLTGLLLLMLVATRGDCQTDFRSADSVAISIGKADSLSIGELTARLTRAFENPVLKTRAIYAWVANNIAYDCPAFHAIAKAKSGAEDVFKLRKAVCEGYANLFMEMCSYAKVECLTISGYARTSVDDIGVKPEATNHAWNAVRINHEWNLIDVTWGSGYTDKKVKQFTPEYSDAYFFTDPARFLYTHYPYLEFWKLTRSNLSLKEFYANPLLSTGFYLSGVLSFTPKTGVIKAKTDQPVNLEFSTLVPGAVNSVIVTIGEEKKELVLKPDFAVLKNTISFPVKFNKPGIYPLKVFVNRVAILIYRLEIE